MSGIMRSRLAICGSAFFISLLSGGLAVAQAPSAGADGEKTEPFVVSDSVPAHDPTVGTLPGEAGTDGGAATYRAPLVVPPGRAGMQPSLSLIYNSRGGDGIAGMGWTISGLSSIHRCPQTPEQDGATLGVSYSSTDRLCLDGQRLIAVNGTYGVPGTEYRTEVDGYARIVQTGGGLTGSATCFRVEQKEGRILHYGAVTNGSPRPTSCAASTANARVQPSGATATLSWQIERIEDRVGNDQLYSYTNFGNGEVLLHTVTYTGFAPTSTTGDRTVTFAYETRALAASAATDIASSYLAGGLTMQTQALQSVTTAVSGATVRTYTPEYAATAYGGRLLMTDLQECAIAGAQPACHPATQFLYNDGPLDYPLTSLSGVLPAPPGGLTIQANPNQLAVISDLDGDGTREVAATAPVNLTDPNHLFLLQMTGDRAAHGAVDLYGTAFSFSPLSYADVDGDGRAELIQFPQSANADAHVSFDVWKLGRGIPATPAATPAQSFAALFQNVPSNIPYTFGQAAPQAQRQTLFMADVDGDGRIDVVLIKPAGPTACGAADAMGQQDGVFVYLNTMTGLLGSAAQLTATFAIPTAPLFCLARTVNSTNSVSYHEQAIEHVADFDGNGLPDFYLVQGGYDGLLNSFAGIRRTQRSGSTLSTTLTSPLQCDATTADECSGLAGYVTHWMDVNGDGLEDFVIARPGQGTWRVRLNQGNGALGAQIDTGSSAGLTTDDDSTTPSGLSFRYANSLPTMDADGDGKPDLLIPSSTQGIHGLALKMCTIKKVRPYANGEGCPMANGATVAGTPSSPDVAATCAAYSCPENLDGTQPLPLNSGQPGYPYQWNGLPAFPAHSSATAHDGPGGDNSVYHLAMLKFKQTGATAVTLVSAETPLVSRLNDSIGHPDDLFGDGLQDLMSSIGCLNITIVNGSPGDNGYWTYPSCSVVGDGTYGPTTLPDGTPTSNFANHVVLYANINQGVAALGGSPGVPLAASQHMTPPVVVPSSPDTALLPLPILPGLMDSATNGVSDFASWGYYPLSVPATNAGVPLYTVPSANGYVDSRHYYFQSSMPVVFGMAQNAGNRDIYGFRSAFYGYSEAMYNHLGRGFQGFRTITGNSVANATDTARQLRTTTTYNQKFPLTGKVASVTKMAPDTSVTLQTETDTWICGLSGRTACPATPAAGTVYAPVLDDQRVNRFDPGNGQGVSHTDTLNAATAGAATSGWDAYGNLVNQLVTSADDGAGGSFVASHITSTTTTYAAADTTNWWLDKLNQSAATTAISYAGAHPLPSGASAPSRSVTTTYQWNTDRTPLSQTAQPNVANQELTTTYSYPTTSYGLPTSVSVSGSAVSPSPRTTQLTYTKDGTTSAADGYFVLTSTNAAGHLTTTQRSPRDGQVTTSIDSNGLKAANGYDVFGHVTSTDFLNASGGTLLPSAYVSYTRCTGLSPSTCPGGYGEDGNQAYAAWRVTRVQAGAPTTAEWVDILGRKIKQVERGFSGTFIESVTDYDSWNAIAGQSTPFFLGGAGYFTGFSYDRLNRPTLKQSPGAELDPTHGNVLTTYAYLGSKTTIKVRGVNVSASCSSTTNLCMDMSRSYDVLGRLEQTVQNNGATANYAVANYWYDGAGNPVAAQDAEGNVIRSSYTDVGQRTDLYDPDAGHWSFTYDALGEVLRQTDARGVYTDHVYDALGRLVQRTANNSASADTSLKVIRDTWSYDPTGATGGAGLLGSAQRSKGATTTALTQIWNDAYSYETATKRLQTQTTTLDGQASPWITGTTYDSNGREQTVSYPSGLVVKNGYTAYGDLNQLSNNATSAVYWTATAKDAWGNLTAETYAGGITGTHQTYASTGAIKQKQWLDASSQPNSWTYAYDSFGNVRSQTSGINTYAFAESYAYDGLQRLALSARFGVAGNPQITYAYTPNGNLSYKSDFSTATAGAYTYASNGCGPHGVSSVVLPVCNSSAPPATNGATPGSSSLCGSVSYTCDANGNVTGGSTLTGGVYDFANAPWSISRIGAGSAQYEYDANGQRFEELASSHSTWFGSHGYERTVSGGQTTHRHELGPVVIDRVGALDGVWGQLRDRLGSLVTLAASNGTFYSSEAYDAFGQVRNWDFSDRLNGTLGELPRTLRGFTGHEHVDDVWLIHMNGRMYDYELGRFLSVDPVIQFPANSQSLNPYSYIGNNPLSGTDPSGYAECFATDAPSCAKDAVNTVMDADSGEKTTLIVANSGQTVRLTDSATHVSNAYTVSNGAQPLDYHNILAANVAPDKIQSLTSKDLGPAKTAAMLSKCAYGSCTLPSDVMPTDLGFNEQNHINPSLYDDASAQFHAESFVSNDGADAYLSFRGTRPTNLQDWVTNVSQGAGLKTQAYQDAFNLGQAFSKGVDDSVNKLYTGHSLGGGLASLAGVTSSERTITFNSAGLSSDTLARYGASHGSAKGLVSAYYLRGEILSTLQDHSPLPRAVGTRIPINPISSTPWSPAARHGMDSVLDAMNGGQ